MPPRPVHSQWFAEHGWLHEPAPRAWLRSRFPALADPDDVIQEACARVLRAHETGPILAVRSFLFVTARNLVLNRLRARECRIPTVAAGPAR